MIRYKTSRNAKILFVGINPHHGSFRRGVPFSNNKMFWYLLNRAGIIRENEAHLKNDKSLKQIFERKFFPVYKLNFINLVNRPSRDVSELKKGEEMRGVKRVLSAIKRYKPRIVCFIGKVTYEKFAGKKNVNFGWQNRLYDSRVYVARFPIRGKASIRIRELKKIKIAVG